MIGSAIRKHGRALALGRRVGGSLVASLALVLVATSFAAAGALGTGGGAGRFAATFEAGAVADPTIRSCPGLGVEGQKIEGRYRGTMSIGGEEYGIHFVLEALVDRSSRLGSAEGRWQLTDLRTADVVGRGELIGVVVAGDPPSELEPPDPDLELQGLLIGTLEPPDPDMPTDQVPTDQKLVGTFTASLDDRALNFTGTVGDPTAGELLPAVLIATDRC